MVTMGLLLKLPHLISIKSAGDVNGDCIDDIAISDIYAPTSGKVCTNTGVVYVIFGSHNLENNFFIGNLNGDNGFSIVGKYEQSYTGFSISGMGDINGDGIDDIIIGSPSAVRLKGEVYVVFGSNSGYPAKLDVSILNGENGFTITGINYHDHVGISVDFIDDFNGDGFDDILIGAPHALDNAGQSYVIFASELLAPSTSPYPSPSPSPSNSPDEENLSNEEKIGIGIGAGAVVIIGTAALIWYGRTHGWCAGDNTIDETTGLIGS